MITQAEIAEARALSRKLKPSRPWTAMALTRESTPDGAQVYGNHVYTCTVRRCAQGWPFGGGPWAQLGIYCEDGEARHDFRDLQRIKNDICGPEWEGIELFPAESRLMDPSNYYLLWCAPSIPIGRFGGRVIRSPADAIGPQRGWSGDAPASVEGDGYYTPSYQECAPASPPGALKLF